MKPIGKGRPNGKKRTGTWKPSARLLELAYAYLKETFGIERDELPDLKLALTNAIEGKVHFVCPHCGHTNEPRLVIDQPGEWVRFRCAGEDCGEEVELTMPFLIALPEHLEHKLSQPS